MSQRTRKSSKPLRHPAAVGVDDDDDGDDDDDDDDGERELVRQDMT